MDDLLTGVRGDPAAGFGGAVEGRVQPPQRGVQLPAASTKCFFPIDLS